MRWEHAYDLPSPKVPTQQPALPLRDFGFGRCSGGSTALNRHGKCGRCRRAKGSPRVIYWRKASLYLPEKATGKLLVCKIYSFAVCSSWIIGFSRSSWFNPNYEILAESCKQLGSLFTRGRGTNIAPLQTPQGTACVVNKHTAITARSFLLVYLLPNCLWSFLTVVLFVSKKEASEASNQSFG